MAWQGEVKRIKALVLAKEAHYKAMALVRSQGTQMHNLTDWLLLTP